ncbi:MAG: tetratricopeptide (TPR) repeat protein, partial [Rhodothermales bacterium]
MKSVDDMQRFRRWALLQAVVTLAALVTLGSALWKLSDISAETRRVAARANAAEHVAASERSRSESLAKVLIAQADALITSQQFAESAAALDAALQVLPNDQEAWYLRGNTRVVAGELAAAGTAYTKAGDYPGAAELVLACAESARAVHDELLSQRRHAEVGALATEKQFSKRAIYHQWINRLTQVGFSSINQADDGGFVLTLTDSVEYAAMREFRKMPIASLRFYNTKVADLSPLAGLQIQSLDLRESVVESLKSLVGMPLRSLNLQNCRKLTTLDGLQNMGLHELNLDGCSALESLDGLQGTTVKKLML